MEASIRLDGRRFRVRLEPNGNGWSADVDGYVYEITTDNRGPGTVVRVGGTGHLIEASPDALRIDGRPASLQILELHGVAGAEDAGAGRFGPIYPPMTGRLDEVLVTAGQTVAAGDVLFVLEAMKMRNKVKASAAGVVSKVHLAAGVAVEPGTAVLDLSPTQTS